MTPPIVAAMTLDCTGLRCPMPIVKLGVAIRQAAPGTRIEIHATDPAFEPDLDAWARKTGHAVLEFERGAIQRAVVEKAA